MKSIQAKLKEDEKNGLARKKQQVADALAAKAARIKLANEKIVAEKKRAEALAKKSKHMSRAAREKQAADSLARQQQLEASIHLDEIPSVESDPTGITGALANIRAPPSPIKSDATKGGGGGGASGASQSTVIPATEDEGAADVIYVLTLEDVVAQFKGAIPVTADATEGKNE